VWSACPQGGCPCRAGRRYKARGSQDVAS
jgi:hypothetical protein